MLRDLCITVNKKITKQICSSCEIVVKTYETQYIQYLTVHSVYFLGDEKLFIHHKQLTLYYESAEYL